MSLTNCCTSSYYFRDITNWNCLPAKIMSRSQGAIFPITPFDGQCQNLQMSSTNFCATYYRLRNIKILNIWPPKSRQRSRSEIFAITSFDGKCQNLQTYFYIFFIFAKVCHMRTILTDTDKQTHTHTQNRQARGYRRNLADLPKNRMYLQFIF